MSADATLVFYGVRYSISPSELEQLEREDHPKANLARASRLEIVYSNHIAMTGGHEGSFLFIGRRLGTFGLESHLERRFTADALVRLMEDVDCRLDDAGLYGPRALYIHYLPDD